MSDVIRNEQLSAILMERQWLSKPFPGTALELIKSHGVIQTQERFAGEEFFRSRGFKDSDVFAELRAKDEVVKGHLHRCTVHAQAKDDYLLWQPIYADKLQRQLSRKGITLPKDWRQKVEAVLGDESYKAKDLSKKLESIFPTSNLDFLVRGSIGAIRIPGPGGSDLGGYELWQLMAGWGELSPEELQNSKLALVKRYLAAFGPARASDFTSWSGITGAQALFKLLDDELWQGVDEFGKTIYDLHELNRIPTQAVPSYLALPMFDNSVLAYGERARIANFSQDEKAEFFSSSMAPLLKNGQVVATWITHGGRGKTRIYIKTIKHVSRKDKLALEQELMNLVSPERCIKAEPLWVKSFFPPKN